MADDAPLPPRMVTTNPPVVLRSLWKVVAMSDEPIDFDIVSDDGDNDAVFAKVSEAARRAARRDPPSLRLREGEAMSVHERISRRATLIPGLWMPSLIADPLRRCEHPAQRPIYGDEIIAAGWKRARCLICGRLLPSLPTPEQDVTKR